MAAVTKSAQYQVVRSNFDRLVKAIAPVVSEVAVIAFAREFITNKNKNDAENLLVNKCDRASQLLDQILNKIDEDKSHFDTFVAMLEEIPVLKSIKETLIRQVSAREVDNMPDVQTKDVTEKINSSLIDSGPVTDKNERDQSVSEEEVIKCDHSVSEKTVSFKCCCGGNCSLEGFVKGKCLGQLKSLFPYLDVSQLGEKDKEKLLRKLVCETNDMIAKFQILKYNVFESLETRKAQVKKVIEVALCFGEEGLPNPISEKHSDELSKFSTIPEVHIFLNRHKYISFINYRILKKIVAFLGTESDKKCLDEYLNNFSEYCKRQVFEIPNYLFVGPEHPTDPLLVVKVNEDVWFKSRKEPTEPHRFTTNDIYAIEDTISKEINLEDGHIFIRDVANGCVQLTFTILSHQVEKIFPLDTNQRDMLLHFGIALMDQPMLLQTSHQSSPTTPEDPAISSTSDTSIIGTKAKTSISKHSCTNEAELTNNISYSDETIEMPCVGRPFTLGMIYNCQNDTLLPIKESIWDQQAKVKVFQTAITSKLEIETLPDEVYASDTLQDKAKELGITGGLRLMSIIDSGAFTRSGSVAFLKDRITFSKQIRVCLKYQSFKMVRKLEPQKVNAISQSNVVGTHIVTEVKYGVEAFLVFDRYETDLDKHEVVHDKMLEVVRLLANNPEVSVDTIMPDKAEEEKYQCTLYADSLQSPQKLPSFRAAVNMYRKLPSTLTPVPKWVKLYPLSRLEMVTTLAEKVPMDISNSIVTKIQNVFEELNQIRVACNDIKSNTLSINFGFLRSHIAQIEDLVEKIESNIMKLIAETVPKIRLQMVDSSKLFEGINCLLPVSLPELHSYTTEKRAEMDQLQKHSHRLLNVEVGIQFCTESELEHALQDWSYTIVCLAFNVVSIKKLSHLMQQPGGPGGTFKLQLRLPWYKDQHVLQIIERQIKQFICFFKANKACLNNKFIVTDNVEEQEEPGAILISCNGKLETFVLPSEPGQPFAKRSDIGSNSVQLEWLPPEKGKENVDSYLVFYRFENDLTQQWNQCSTSDVQTKLQVTGLLYSTSYIFKVQPKCKNELYGLESKESEPITTKDQAAIELNPEESKVLQLPVPRVLSLTHNRIKVKWENHTDTNVSNYILSYRPIESDDWTMKETSKTSLLVSGLAPSTKYVFRVKPQCKTGTYICIESEESKPFETKSASRQPGKPHATLVTSNSVHLVWEELQHIGVDYYILSYQCTDSTTTTEWKKMVTNDSRPKAVVSELEPKTSYHFKVRPIFTESAESVESEHSDPIMTEPPKYCKVSPPQPLDSYSAVTHDTITLSWSKPKYNQEKVELYIISYCKLKHRDCNYQQNWTKKATPGPQECATIEGLTPNTQYIFKVRPECKDDTGVFSDESDPISTKPVCQPGKPESIHVTHNSVELHWEIPTFGSHQIISYSVLYCLESTPQKWEKHETKNTKSQYIVKGLIPNTRYIFKVLPESMDSDVVNVYSEASNPVTTGQPVCQPGKPYATTVTQNSVELNWNKPGYESDNVYFYIISYGVHGEELFKKKPTPDNNLSLVITNLEPNTVYQFQVRPECTANICTMESEFSNPIKTQMCSQDIELKGVFNDTENTVIVKSAKPLECRPGNNTSKPGKPTATMVTDTTILLTWTHPVVGQDSIRRYTIFYCQDTSSKSEWNSCSTDSFTDQLMISQLRHKTKYFFKVRPESTHATNECESDISVIETNATSEPLEVEVTRVTPAAVQLKWNKPVRGQQSIRSYDVYYQESEHNQEWKKNKVADTEYKITISGLKSSKEYKFKVVPVCDVGKGTESEIVQVKTKQLVCKPGTITVISKKQNCIHLKWNKPEYGTPKYYTCSYRFVLENQWKEVEQKPTTEEVVIKGLKPNTTYVFRINPEFENIGEVNTEETISEWIWTDKIPVAERLKAKCKQISGGPISVYKIPTKMVWEGEQLNRIAKYELDIEHPPLHYTTERVLMLVGVTGAGKSTLINGIVNYLYKVEYEDNFRFKMICDESDHDQTHCQTSSVNAYTIYPLSGSRINYTLTIIDAPGFGKIRGVQQDQELFGQIKDFFTHSTPDDKGFDQIHGVGFVVKNSEVRLTATQKYIFSSILSVFGKNIQDNIFLMVTFADGAKPPVLEAVKEAEFPFKEHFIFNNSALYPETKDSDPVSIPNMWEMGQNSFQKFFQGFENYLPQSLTLTKETLEERERLDSYLKTLRDKITKGVQDIDKLQQLKEKLLAKEQNIDDFKITVNVTKQRKVDLRRGVYVTNCLNCNRTCHDNCGIPSDSQKYNCCVMDRRNGATNATCTVCAGKCHWSKHVNNPYKFELYTESQEQTIDDLKKHHDKAKLGKLTTEAMIKDLEEGLEDLRNHVMSLVENAQKSLERLAQIALKPNPLSSEDYIDLLIQEEMRERRTGYEKRIAAYEQLKTKDIIHYNVTASSLNRQHSGDTSADKPKKKRWYHSLFEMFGGSN